VTRPRFLADENIRTAIIEATLRLDPTIEFVRVQDIGLASTPDPELLEFAHANGWVVVSHDVNTLKGIAEQRLRDDVGLAGLFLAPAHHSSRTIATDLVAIAGASEAEEWHDMIVFLPL
jgi:hypothetical protein